jgi:hypothetical protein
MASLDFDYSATVVGDIITFPYFRLKVNMNKYEDILLEDDIEDDSVSSTVEQVKYVKPVKKEKISDMLPKVCNVKIQKHPKVQGFHCT